MVNNDFVPKRIKAYKIPGSLKPEVDRQIQELLRLGFVQEDETPMASPIVCILKGKDGKNGARIAIDYRYVNKFTRADALPLPNPLIFCRKLEMRTLYLCLIVLLGIIRQKYTLILDG